MLVRSFVTAASLLLPASVSAKEESVTARLAYGAVDACPDEASLRSLVAQRLGFDPFRPASDSTVTITIVREGHELVADVRYQGASQRRGERQLRTPDDDCGELATSVALTVAIMLDPRAFGQGAPKTQEPEPELPPQVPHREVPHRERPEATLRPASAWSWRFGAGPTIGLGAAPAPSIGATLFAGARSGRFSADVEGRADLPASRAVGEGAEVASSLLVAGVVPCARVVGSGGACFLLAAGALRGEARQAGSPDRLTTFYATVGGRLFWEIDLAPSLALRFRGELTSPLTPTSLAIGGTTQWTTPSVAAALGIDVVWKIP